jgi:hypothetical protein
MVTWLSSTKTDEVVRESSPAASVALSGRAAGQMARIVFDAWAEAHLGQQLEVVHRALLEALRFQQPILSPKELETIFQFGANVAHRDFHPV